MFLASINNNRRNSNSVVLQPVAAGARFRVARLGRLFVSGCLAAVLCQSAVAESIPSHLSQDAQVNQARKLIDDGRYQAALEVLRPLAKPQREDITDIRFLIGLSAIAAAEQSGDEQQKIALLDEAIAALHTILIDRPQLTRVRLELARAFFAKGDDDLSKKHFERVLAGKPSQAIAGNIRRFLHAIRGRRRWSGYFAVNLEENNNINSGSKREGGYLLSGQFFTFDKSSRPTSDNGIAFAGGVGYEYPVTDRWRWHFGADAVHNEYRGHVSDQTSLVLRSGPRWLLAQHSDVSLQGFAGQRWYAGSRHSTEFGLRFNANHQLSRQLGLGAQASWKNTDYRQTSTASDTSVTYAFHGTYLFSPLLQGNAGIGFSRSKPQREGSNSSYSRSFSLGLNITLPYGWTAGGNFEWSRNRHGRDVPCQGSGGCSPQRQVDNKRSLRLLLLNRGFTLFGFSPQLLMIQEWQDSNFARSAYQRTRFDLRFNKQF